ncbi:MAG: ABC transporter substrate-binding protein, partial [Anaerolineae bacterium]
MKTAYKLFTLLIVLLVLVSCGATEAPPATEAPQPEPTQAEAEPTTAPEPEPTEAEEAVPTEAPMAGLTCDEPIKIGLITDLTGGLAIYGTMIERSFMLGMEYATGAPPTGDNVFQLDDCEIQVLLRDDQGSAETTATLARELIEVDEVDLLVGTVSSGSTATLQEIALENDVVLIVAPAAANDITGINFNDHTFRTSRENYQDSI